MIRARIHLVICFLASCVTALGDAPPEFRAAWVTRFEWVSPDTAQCKADITNTLESLAKANFNAVVFQIRGCAETLYPSTLEPWSPLIGGKDPGFDPVAFAIQEARRHGLSFHAYINPMPLAESRGQLPQDPAHLFNTHGPGSAEPWVCVDRDGNPARTQYYYLAAGIPAVHAYLRSVIMDVVRRYEVDGIHLDRIRFPGPEYSHDPITRRRFLGRGNPSLMDWADWQRSQLDKFINDLAAEIRAEKPRVVLSCAAWGIYNRHHIDGYTDFSSGYHDYYQDTWNWCRIGAMDVLMPMIYWNLSEPKPNYDELLRDFVRGVGPDHLVGGQSVFSPEENVRQIEITRETGSLGTVLYNFRSAQRRGVLDALSTGLYKEKAPLPVLPRHTRPERGGILGTIQAEDGQPLVDAWVSIKTDAPPRGRRRSSTGWTSGEDGRFAFLNLPPGRMQVVAEYEGLPAITSDPIEVRAGEIARVQLTIPGGRDLRDKPWLTILQPRAGHTTSESVVHLLGRAAPGARVTVAGQAVEVYSNGAFARDGIALEPGDNRIEIVSTEGDRAATRILTVTRTPAPPTQPTIATAPRTSEPERDVALPAGVRVAEVTSEEAGILTGLHEVRLGGPWLGWVPRGTRFEVSGQRGNFYRVQLSGSLSGWISARQIDLLPAGTSVPHNYSTSCEVSGRDDVETVTVRLLAPIVVTVRPEVTPTNRLILDLFNTHDAMTWISHKSTARILGPVTAEQIETDRVRLTVPVGTRQIWGYWTELKDGVFTLYVRRAPAIAAAPDSPLKGLTIAIEAGHGGSGTGAMGLFGTQEKTVNLEAALKLQQELEGRGARVVQVRRHDEEPSLSERAARANQAGADFFVSIHANSAGNTRGFLRTSGTSTYYHGIHCQRAAALIYEELLKLGWGEFGVVGNFSYAPLRNTRTPGILIEQAFMSHPGDEARLVDPVYQRQQALAVVSALERFFAEMREQPATSPAAR